MKIIYVSSLLTIYDYRFLKKMIEYKFDVTHLAFIFNDEQLKLPYVSKIKNLKGLKQKFFNLKKPFNKPFLKLNKIINFYKFKKFIEKENPDILHGGWAPVDGFFCALTSYHPFLFMAWGTDILIEPFNSKCNFFKVRYTIRKADMITCDCDFQKQYIIKIGGPNVSEIVTFPWGIEREIFNYNPDISIREKLGFSKEDIVFVMNRNFKKVYGHKYFIEAFEKLTKDYDNIKLILIGSGPLKDEILNDLNKRKLGKKYVYIGNLYMEDMPIYLNSADIYVSASLSDGVSCSMLEAMSCGLPVITTNIPVNYEWIKDGVNGYIAEKGNSDSLYKSMKKIIENKSKWDEIRKNNIKETEERADWNKNFEKLVSMYNKLVR